MSVEWIENLKVGDEVNVLYSGLGASVHRAKVIKVTQQYIVTDHNSPRFRKKDGKHAGDIYLCKLVPLDDPTANALVVKRNAEWFEYRLRKIDQAPTSLQEEFIDFAKGFVPRLEASKKGRE